MKISKTTLILLLSFFSQSIFSQELLKSNFSSFAPITTNNDSLLITSSQSVNTYNSNQTVLNGYFPLFYSTLNVNEYKPDDFTINIYPNPFNSNIYITSKSTNYSIIKITNLQGELIFESNKPLTFIDLKEIESGIYFMTFITKDNITLTKKIVKY